MSCTWEQSEAALKRLPRRPWPKGGTTRFLCELLQAEYEQRAENARAKRLKTAGFPQYKYMEELDPDELPEGVRPLLNELKTFEFIRQGRNAVFYGNPGTGKTHLSIALGILACKQHMTVLFTSVPHLITQIKECRSHRRCMHWRPDSTGTTSSSATNSDTWPATRREGNCYPLLQRPQG